ncbi:MAG: HAMP domain-containing protein [Acidobacteria bacterium]|nr:HAMP domain-containing protein [Acidobacteriota bacterium]MBI3656878.1 HAMP domain-containing protein [Acidobacteriota bacterium]
MRGLKYNSLKFKTSLVIAVAVTLILILESYISTQISEQVVEQQLKDRANDASNNLHDYLKSPEALQRNELTDSVELDNFIHNLLYDQRDFVKVEVYAVSGSDLQRIAEEHVFDFQIEPALYEQVIREKRTIRKPYLANEGERLWIVAAPVMVFQTVIGVFSVSISLNDVYDLSRRQTKYAFLSAAISILFLTLVLIYYLNRAVSNPIQSIVVAMEKVKSGDLTASTNLRSNDEIGELAKNFDTMVAKIKAEDEKIANFNKELQVRIAEAVQELNDRNQDLVRLTENLFETQKELSRMETLASMGQLAASVAHEIGTPLHSISGHVQLLLEKESLRPDVTDKLRIIQAQIMRLTEIINRTLNATKLPAPKLEPVDINAILKEIINLIQPGLRKKRIALTAEFSDPLRPVRADQNQLQQVLLNLVSNAIEAMPSGGHLRLASHMLPRSVESSARISDASVTPGLESPGIAEIVVEDTGEGIAHENLRSIFKPFFSTKNSRKAAGLGLAISRAIIKDHHGNIDVRSEIGRGAKFIIQLPVISDEPSA